MNYSPRIKLEELSIKDLKTLIAAGMVYASGRTSDGKVTEYSLTWKGRQLTERFGSGA